MPSGAVADHPDLLTCAAGEIACRVRAGTTTAVEVARAHLARVAARDGELGAFEAVDAERVLAEAAGVDARPDRFALPLAGVPVAVKDNVPVAGHPTRHGSAAASTAPARRDDELVKRLRRAGAVVVGKTRMPELAVWGFTQSALGVTRNPLDPERDPGGSSGGSAAAVAAGMAALALGTDGGGSIRVPAAYCGLVGLKPGSGELPLPGGADEHWFGLTAPGPLARTAADAAVMFAVLAGRDAAAARRAVEVGAAFGRVAISLRSPSPVAELTAENRLATVGAAVLLRAGGAVLAAADPPYSGGTASHWSIRWQAGVARDAAELDLDLDADRAADGDRRPARPGCAAPGRAPTGDGRGLAGEGARLVRRGPPRRPAHPGGRGPAGEGGRHAPPRLPVDDAAVGLPRALHAGLEPGGAPGGGGPGARVRARRGGAARGPARRRAGAAGHGRPDRGPRGARRPCQARRHGPVIAYRAPGTWTFANSTAPSAEYTGPVNSPPSARAIG